MTSSQIFLDTFTYLNTVKVMRVFFTKNGQGDILGDIFLQTHLVTVVSKDATFIFSGNRPLTHSLRICRLKPEAVCCAGTGSGSGCGGAA
jgi:hypothetical protein